MINAPRAGPAEAGYQGHSRRWALPTGITSGAAVTRRWHATQWRARLLTRVGRGWRRRRQRKPHGHMANLPPSPVPRTLPVSFPPRQSPPPPGPLPSVSRALPTCSAATVSDDEKMAPTAKALRRSRWPGNPTAGRHSHSTVTATAQHSTVWRRPCRCPVQLTHSSVCGGGGTLGGAHATS